MTLNSQQKAILASYARAILGAEIAVYLSGSTNSGDYAKALVAAVAPVVLRWLNKNDVAFGRGYTPTQFADVVVEDVVKVAKAVKKTPVKKAPATKPAVKKTAPKTPAKKTAETTKGKTAK